MQKPTGSIDPDGRMYVDGAGPQDFTLPPGDYRVIWQSGDDPPQIDMLNFRPHETPAADAADAAPPVPSEAQTILPVVPPAPLPAIKPAKLAARPAKAPQVTQAMQDAMISQLEETMPTTIQHNSFKIKHLNPLYWLWKKKK